MDRIEFTQSEREIVQVIKSNIQQTENQLTSWRFGLQALLNSILNRTVQTGDSYVLTADGTALVKETPRQTDQALQQAPQLNGADHGSISAAERN